jgi:hypothetical protein
MMGFPSPTSPMMAPVRLQMHGRNGVHVDTSDEDGDEDDDDEDEFEDSEPTEATATGTDMEESATSEGEMCATPESGGSNDGGPRTVADKWVTVKGGLLLAPLPPPQVMALEAMPAVPIAGARS